MKGHSRFVSPLFLAAILLILVSTSVFAAQLFVEGLGDSVLDTSGTAITTSNTNFEYVRIGSGGGAIESINPATLGGGVNNSNSMSLGGSTSGSLNGVGATSLSSTDVTTMNFRMKFTTDPSGGDIFIGMGTGSMFTDNSTFSTGDLMWGIQSDAGNLEYRTTGWNNFGQTLTLGTEYHFNIVANNTGSSIDDYDGAQDVGAGKMDLYLNGSLLGDDVDIAGNQSSTAFRIYQVGSTTSTTVEIDNIQIDNAALGPFTPTSITLSTLSATGFNPGMLALALAAILAIGAGAFVLRRRAVL